MLLQALQVLLLDLRPIRVSGRVQAASASEAGEVSGGGGPAQPLTRPVNNACLPPARITSSGTLPLVPSHLFALPEVIQGEHALLWRPRLEATSPAKGAARRHAGAAGDCRSWLLLQALLPQPCSAWLQTLAIRGSRDPVAAGFAGCRCAGEAGLGQGSRRVFRDDREASNAGLPAHSENSVARQEFLSC